MFFQVHVENLRLLLDRTRTEHTAVSAMAQVHTTFHEYEQRLHNFRRIAHVYPECIPVVRSKSQQLSSEMVRMQVLLQKCTFNSCTCKSVTDECVFIINYVM